MEIRATQKRWFAVCPVCDNPLQIIGMLERDASYGKHFFPLPDTVSVPPGRVNKEEYAWCSYASKIKSLRSLRSNRVKNHVKEITFCFIYKKNQPPDGYHHPALPGIFVYNCC
ncbi:hypothetical protein EHW66_09560 [Erwinia psidii]|uniref:Uncharacterized protein n=1 Tax=Erwinia psidii TaxID=69224 RepID=A0A3N6SGW0_9GAMM|nr:hypothetical protein [Erwinia psidii]MCX8965249.1 hypothetical protein [Erwinia psidii]RQM37951.1 hypothetical protein EB241_11735 [Erwinia psidii]